MFVSQTPKPSLISVISGSKTIKWKIKTENKVEATHENFKKVVSWLFQMIIRTIIKS